MKMKFFRQTITLCAAAALFASCNKSGGHFLKDRAYREMVHRQFELRSAQAANRSEALFSVFEREDLTPAQREALEFLYAYMPLGDLADYDGEFFLKQVNAAFRAREYFPWGRSVPDDLFRHFVLVYRINNENLDTARVLFFDELKDRVKNLSMYDAALEVNHWCHEKVTYRGTDARTLSPLALVRTSWGRCGEESTFTTTALRAVGIPARQCYTPRWAHTDNNHAWVEAWIDGKWYYMGACEPEPEMNVAWFTDPSARAMMVHTNVFGPYNGPEEKNWQTPLYSKINLLGNYADTRVVKVRVLDENDRPAEGVQVKFNVYNYAEFYTVATSVTDSQGNASIISGMGDLLVWADRGEVYGYKLSKSGDVTTDIKLDRKQGAEYEENIVIEVPPERTAKGVAPEKIAANGIRLAREDSLRNAYMQTFISEKQARDFAAQNRLDADQTWKYLHRAQGNWRETATFLERMKNDGRLFGFLSSLTEKDLRDTPAEYLAGYLESCTSTDRFVYSPRIETELIRPFGNFPGTEEVGTQAGDIIAWVKDNITINDEDNYYKCRISPQGVYDLRLADRPSRDVFFVALCRRLGIPARIDPAASKPQYHENGEWIDAVFDEQAPAGASKTKLTLRNSGGNQVKPGYYTHYTLAYFEKGDFHTLDYGYSPDAGSFPRSLELNDGYYRLIVGGRANDGSVAIHTRYFVLQGKPLDLTVAIPETEGKLFVKGIVDMNSTTVLKNGDKTTLKEQAKGKGLMLCFVDLGKEPSKHILQDLGAVSKSLESWGGGILLMVPDDKGDALDASGYAGLPRQMAWGVDRDRSLLKSVAGALQTDFQDNFPLTVYLSRNGGILYSSCGYQIGAGETILKIIGQENLMQ
jgi:transglutaminase-like putative cysteine protease